MNEQEGEPGDGRPGIPGSSPRSTSFRAGSQALRDASSLDSARDEQDERLVDHPRSTGDEVLITHHVRAERTMTTWGAVGIGVTISAILAAVFWASYSGWSAIYCSGLPRQCPSSWVPYAIVATAGFVVMMLIGAAAAWVFFKLYTMLRVD